PDGRLLVVAGRPDRGDRAAAAGNLKAWDVRSGRLLHTEPGTFQAAWFSPDGKRLFGLAERKVRVWSLAGGREQRPVDLGGFHHGARPDRLRPRLAGVNARGAIRVWDLAAGKELVTLSGHAAGTDTLVCFSPDGRHLATADHKSPRGGGTVRLWDLTTG